MGLSKGLALSAIVVALVTESGVEAPSADPSRLTRKRGRLAHSAGHCQRQCPAVNLSKATLEGAFVDELTLRFTQTRQALDR